MKLAAVIPLQEHHLARRIALPPEPPRQLGDLPVIQHLEEIIGTVVQSLANVSVDEVNVLDQGDGSGLATYAATYPKMVAAVVRARLRSLRVERVNGASVFGTPLAEALQEAGFVATPQGLRIRV